MFDPGRLAWKRRAMLSCGWMQSSSRLGSISPIAEAGNDWCGTGRNWMQTSEAWTGIRLPVRR